MYHRLVDINQHVNKMLGNSSYQCSNSEIHLADIGKLIQSPPPPFLLQKSISNLHSSVLKQIKISIRQFKKTLTESIVNHCNYEYIYLGEVMPDSSM